MHCSARSMCVLNIYAFPIGYHTERIGRLWSTLDQQLSFLQASLSTQCLAQFCFYAHNVNVYIYSYVAHMHSSFLRPFNPALRVCLLCVANSLTLYVRFLLGGRSYKKSTAKSARRQCMKRDHNTMPTLLAKAGAYVFHRYCSILFLAPDAIDLNSSKKITPCRGLLCQIGTKESQTSL
jgi:hypothetical protein